MVSSLNHGRRRRACHGWTATAGALGAAMAACSPALAAPPQDGPPVFVGYVYGRGDDVTWERYTHLCHAFVTPSANGRIERGRNAPSRELVDQAHQAGVRVLLSLGGWGWDEQFAAIVADSAAEDRCVEEMLSLVAGFGYDGVDLDWEYPDTKEEIAGFERFARKLRAGLDEQAQQRGKPMLLTMASAANPGTLRWLERDFLISVFDWVNIMTYDYAGAWSKQACHNAPLFASSQAPGGAQSIERTVRFLLEERKVPPQRLALGLPLYGRGFAVAKPYLPTEGAPKPKHGSVTYAAVTRLIEQGWERRWDDETKTPWLLAPDGSEVIGYDDAESLAGKTTWAMNLGLRGVFFWEVRQDRLPDGTNPLQQAARKAWSAAGSTQLP